MAQLAFLVSLVALAVALLAYQEAGGSKDLAKRIESVKQETAEGIARMRQETADGLSKLERALRPSETPKPKP